MLTDYAESGTGELWNTARLQAYLTNVGSPFDTGPDICNCETLTAAVLGDEPYDTPTADPAPWYDVDVDQSAKFLGFLPLSIEGLDDNPRARNVTNVVGGGGVFGPARDLPRTITVTGLLLGTSCCGVDYGMHYLTEVLNSCAGDGCGGTCLSMYACCPEPGLTPEQFNAKHRRNFVRTALVSGPTVVARNATGGGSCSTGGCSGADILQVEFVLVAGIPWAWTDPAPVLDVTVPMSGQGDCVEWCLDATDGVCEGEPCLFRDCTDPEQCQDPLHPQVVPPQPSAPETVFCTPLVPERACYSIDLTDRPRWSEDLPIVTVDSGGAPLRNVRVTFYENPNPALPCDSTADSMLCNPTTDIYITYIPPNSQVIVDGRTGQATLTCVGRCVPATTVYGSSDGAPLTVNALTCASYCVCIETDSNFPPAEDATVSIEITGKGL